MLKPRKSLLAAGTYALQKGRLGKLRLDLNENTVGPSPRVFQELKKLGAEELAAYPEGEKLLKALADYCRVKPENVVAFNGSFDGLERICSLFGDKGRKAVIPVPSYKPYQLFAKRAGLKVTKVLYNRDFSFPEERVLKAIDSKTSLVLLCSPNNPTGTTIPLPTVKRIARKAKNGVVVVDEDYIEFGGKTAVKLIKRHGNLLVLRSFSKAFGLAGLRVGYAVGPKKLIDWLKIVSPEFAVNSAGMRAAIAAVKDKAYVKAYAGKVRASRRLAKKVLAGMGVETFFAETNSFLVRLGKRAGRVVEALKAQGILVRNLSAYPLLSGWCRVTLGTPPQARMFLKEFRQTWQKIGLSAYNPRKRP